MLVTVSMLLGIAILPQKAEAQTASTANTTLVLYDTTNQWGHLGELYATMVANLVGRFGAQKSLPVTQYKANMMDSYKAVIYIGSTYDEPLPAAFLTDVNENTKKVMWIGSNIWQLTAADANFQTKFGWNWKGFDYSEVHEVAYKGRKLTRSAHNNSGIMDYVISDAAKVKVVAEAVRKSDQSKFPWAVSSGNLTYVGEIPFAYINETDRQLIFADMLFDLLDPNAKEQHRALVRLEDVGPDADPDSLRAIADYLHSEKVPFSVAVYSRYVDSLGIENNGRPETYALWQRPEVVKALKYMQSKGGTLLMHGWTHQYGKVINPYDGRSGNDFEFFAAHVDPVTDYVIYDGPVKEDSAAWAKSRITGATLDFVLSGLSVPKIFEFPHYAGSAVDYKAVKDAGLGTRYERSLYFNGTLSGKAVNNKSYVGQLFPYVVKDVYGSKVLPENMGNYESEGYNNHPPRLAADLVKSAEANLVVRDGFASFFFHPYYELQALKDIVKGVKGTGYTFVSSTSL